MVVSTAVLADRLHEHPDWGGVGVFLVCFDIVAYQDFLGQTFDAPGQLPVGSTQVDPNALDDDY